MGTFMASASFRRTEKMDWQQLKPAITEMFQGIDGLVSNLDSEGNGYAIVSPYGDLGMFLADLPARISRLTGDYAVLAVCVDSDFAMLELYLDGRLMERTSIGNVYDDIDELAGCGKPELALWKPLLMDITNAGQLEKALLGNEIFVDDQLRVISTLTGIPVFDDELVFGSED